MKSLLSDILWWYCLLPVLLVLSGSVLTTGGTGSNVDIVFTFSYHLTQFVCHLFQPSHTST